MRDYQTSSNLPDLCKSQPFPGLFFFHNLLMSMRVEAAAQDLTDTYNAVWAATISITLLPRVKPQVSLCFQAQAIPSYNYHPGILNVNPQKAFFLLLLQLKLV